MRRKKFTNIVAFVFLASILVSVVSFLTVENVAVFKNLKLKSIDLRFNYRGPVENYADTSKIVIVAIEGSSLDKAPDRWPWPRSYYARLIRNLKRAGARVVAIDINFDEPDKNAKNDEELRKAIEETGIVVLAGRSNIGARVKGKLVKSKSILRNIFYGTPNSSVGVVYVPRDEDGICRRYYPAFQVGDSIYPSFGLAVILKYLNLPLDSVFDLPGYFKVGKFLIPKYDDYTWMINYAGPSGSFKYIDFIDVIDDKEFKTKDELEYGDINTFDDPDFGLLYSDVFKDKIVVVGSALPEFKGELADMLPVPFKKSGQSNLMYGVEIHANAIATVLDRNFIVLPSKFTYFVIIFLISIFSLGVIVLLKQIELKYNFVLELLSVVAVLLISGLWVYVSFFMFKNKNLLLPVISPVFAVLLSYFSSIAYQYLTERKQKLLIKSMFSHYVHPSVVNQLLANPDMLKLSGERKELTVLFTDIVSFTTMSESYDPEFVFNHLNEYFETMTRIIFKHGGTLDKYIGDAIVAFWGAPIPQKDHALRACVCALEMQAELEKLREKWRSEGKPLIYMRCGINTGEMVVGNVGGYGRFNYTVIGDSVNLGARLESANKEFGTSIMISEYTYEKVKDFVNVRELGTIIVKGKTKPVRVYELKGLKEEVEKGVEAV